MSPLSNLAQESLPPAYTVCVYVLSCVGVLVLWKKSLINGQSVEA